MNLLLTGEATSNIMDGSVTMAPGLVVKGVSGRSDCGYLTHLEALRYCVVGEYLKVFLKAIPGSTLSECP